MLRDLQGEVPPGLQLPAGRVAGREPRLLAGQLLRRLLVRRARLPPEPPSVLFRGRFLEEFSRIAPVFLGKLREIAILSRIAPVF